MSSHRELNPFLFGTPTSSDLHPVDPNKPAAGIMGKGPEAAQAKAPHLPGDIKALEHQVNSLRVAFIQAEKRSESILAKMEDLSRTVHGRLERFSQALIRMEEIQNNQKQENQGKFAQIAAKVNERKVSDSKVQELIDRHNTVIRNFENRLLSLQRVVSEQEMALHNAQAALEEARIELLKRR